MFKSRIGYLPAIAAGLLAVSAIAGASDPWSEEPPSVTVRYGDLDLSAPQGRSMLYRRLSHAARQVCPSADARELKATALSNACRTHAVRQAMRTIGGPLMARLASEHGISLD
jgi:UrcA family protein